MPIANQGYPQLNKYINQSYLKDKNRGMFDTKSKGNKTIFFDSDNEKRPSNQKDLLISKVISKYPTNYAPVPSPYKDGVIQGYYIKVNKAPKYDGRTHYQTNTDYYGRNIENGGEDYEEERGNEGNYDEDMDYENGKEFPDVSPRNYTDYYPDYIGGGNVRNNMPNFAPNPYEQNIRYSKKNNFTNYNSDNYNNYGPEYENEDDQYLIDSPEDNCEISGIPYRRRHIIGNLGDSASSEAYANKSNQNYQNSDIHSKIYVKPKTKYNNKQNIYNNGILTEERGIESQRDIPNKFINNGSYIRKPFHYIDSEGNKSNIYNKINNYDEDSSCLAEPPSYKRPLNLKMNPTVCERLLSPVLCVAYNAKIRIWSNLTLRQLTICELKCMKW
jgi:hypothetical protein